jgi:aldehyde:ferredoxin oxidoreductase
LVAPPDAPERELEFVTGEKFDMMRSQAIGERVAVLRHAFNLREGINPVEIELPKRLPSGSMLPGGPNKGVEVDNDAQRVAYFATMGWDQETAKPPKEQLIGLGLDFVIPDLYASA